MSLPTLEKREEPGDAEKKDSILRSIITPLTSINTTLKGIVTFVRVEKNRAELAREEAQSEAASGARATGGGGVMGFISKSKDLFGELARRFIVFLAPTIMMIYEGIKKIAPAVSEFTQKAATYLTEAGTRMTTIVSGFVSDVVTRVGNAINAAFGDVLGVADQYFTGVTNIVVGVINSINDFITQLVATGRNVVAAVTRGFNKSPAQPRNNARAPSPPPAATNAPPPRGGGQAAPVSRPAPQSAPPIATPTTRSPAVPTRTQPNTSGASNGLLDKARAQLAKHEGRKDKPYKDSKGLWTVGIGHLIGDGKSLPASWNRTFSDAEIDALFAKDFEKHLKIAQKTPGWSWATETQKLAMIDLAFNMGAWFSTPTWRGGETVAALARGAFADAAERLRKSAWARQVGDRAVTVTNELASGGNRIPSPSAEIGANVGAATTNAGTGAAQPPQPRPQPRPRSTTGQGGPSAQTNDRPAAGTGVDQNAVRSGYLRRLFGG